MKLWTSISAKNEDKRWQALSAVLTSAGAANEFVPWTAGVDLPDLTGLAKFHHVRLSTRMSQTVLKQMKIQSSWITLLGVVDGMVLKAGAWWPLCALYESFGQILLGLGQDLDLRGSVLVAGHGPAARTAVGAFFKAGFRHFLLTGTDDNEVRRAVTEIQAKFFGLTIQCVPMERIVLLPGESAVLVNCTPAEGDNPLLTELSYLNFLKRPGFLFDMNLSTKTGALAQDAADAGVKVIHGLEMAARGDVLWANWAFQANIDLAEYRKTLEQALIS